MAYVKQDSVPITSIDTRCPELETDYSDPVLGRSLSEHLKTYWLIKEQYMYAETYPANKVRELLEPAKFTEKDWLAIALVCGKPKPKSWAYSQLEQYEQA